MKISADWYKSFFKDSFYNPSTPESLDCARKEALFVLKELKAKKNNELLDLCCGQGRHSIEFAKKGIKVTGCDFSESYLSHAKNYAKKNNLKIAFKKKDMRHISFFEQFDFVVNLFTSFGYFTNIADDKKTLNSVYRSLKKNGIFVLDIINGEYVRNNFIQRDWIDFGDSYRLDENELTAKGMNSSWTVVNKKTGKIQTKYYFNRLYTKDSISKLLKQCGFTPFKFYGDFKGKEFSNDDIRLIVFAKKNYVR